MLNKSISIRVVAALSLLMIIGMGVLLTIQSQLSYNFFSKDFTKNYNEKTHLFASQMVGAIKWKKTDEIENVYEAQIQPNSKSNLSDVLVLDKDNNLLTEYHSKDYENVDLSKFIILQKEKLQNKESVTLDQNNHVVTFVPVIDKKKDSIIGYVAMGWSKKAALTALSSMAKTSMIISAIITLTIVLALIFILRIVAIKPIISIQKIMNNLSKGELNDPIPFSNKKDEIGHMARALKVFRDNEIDKLKMEEEQSRSAEIAEKEKKKLMQKIAQDFDSKVGQIVLAVENASVDLQEMASQLTSSIYMTSEQSSSVATAAQQASVNIKTVATTSEEMSQSIKEISGKVLETANSAKSCTSAAEVSQNNLDSLQVAVDDIDTVIQSINDVAEQTNLLALNATIEAARAGEAGKGFAVVANEVKNLAGQTHKMTDEIAQKVIDIKESASQTISSMNDIIKQISTVNEQTTGIASAIEEQNTITSEIASSVIEVSQGSDQVSKHIQGVQEVAQSSSKSTENLKVASGHLSEQSIELKEAINRFMKEFKAG